jgi:hypothetical protein
VKALKKFKAMPRVEGISTTTVITRIVGDYDAYINKSLDRGATMRDLKIGYIKVRSHNRQKTVFDFKFPSYGDAHESFTTTTSFYCTVFVSFVVWIVGK